MIIFIHHKHRSRKSK